MKNRQVRVPLLVLAMTMTPFFMAGQTYSFPPTGRFILPLAEAREIFRQCSRIAPSPKSEIWTPSEKDIEDLELSLQKYLGQREKASQETPPKGRYNRQYVGFVRNGERYIYGNFYPAEKWIASYESSRAVQICDGGPRFWGIVFRVKTKAFEDIHFNGVA